DAVTTDVGVGLERLRDKVAVKEVLPVLRAELDPVEVEGGPEGSGKNPISGAYAIRADVQERNGFVNAGKRSVVSRPEGEVCAVDADAKKRRGPVEGTTSTQSTSSIVRPVNESFPDEEETYALDTPPQVMEGASLAAENGADEFAMPEIVMLSLARNPLAREPSEYVRLNPVELLLREENELLRPGKYRGTEPRLGHKEEVHSDDAIRRSEDAVSSWKE
ncbi:hypothetical protein QFC19_009527, partial [Naganishia cerealis]